MSPIRSAMSNRSLSVFLDILRYASCLKPCSHLCSHFSDIPANTLFPIRAMRYPVATEATPESSATVCRMPPRPLIPCTLRKTDFRSVGFRDTTWNNTVTIVVVAEKPSVARDIAQVVGAKTRASGWLHGKGYVVTWAIGHLVGLAQPHEINPDWKAWRAESLPMLPDHWPLAVLESAKEQFRIVKKLIQGRDVEYLVCATDAGREGELIFRFIYEAAGSRKPVRRLWISSLTPSAI